jgi:dipeptidyl aminopeptidase/acylaminoacyl peptidase
MRREITPGKARKSINFIDNITYSRQPDLNGDMIDLKMSIMLQNGNSEMRLAVGWTDEEDKKPKPAILWVPGGGYRGCDKNLMVAEMAFLADAGYVVASMYYRSSAQTHFPDQIIDVKTAIRFLRAHAAEYEIDPDHIGIIGRSAGGHLSSLAATNVGKWHSGEWGEYSDEVQACVDMFGPVDIVKLLEFEEELYKADPENYRWESIAASHGGALLGGDKYDEEMIRKAAAASTGTYISSKMAPIMILHGDIDKLVPVGISEDFYRQLVDAGLEDRSELYILHNAGHGTKDFFQPSVKELIREFFDKYLR